MKRIFFISLFLIFAPLTLSVSLFSLNQIQRIKQSHLLVLGTSSSLELYSALPPVLGTMNQLVVAGEARPIIMKRYLEEYHSPIAVYADLIFQISQKYDLDFRLMIAIAQCESNLCKKIPAGSYNCWGFENGQTRFLSWEQAFEQVGKTLKEDYINQGLTTPEQIMPKYAPPSVEKGGPWAKCVSRFMEEME